MKITTDEATTLELISGDGVRLIYQSYTGTPLLNLTEENLDKLLTNARNAFNPTRDATDGGEIPGVNFYFGGTSLLIVVGVAMDTVNQIEAQLIMRHYEGFTPRAGRIRGRRSTS
jgi:hypothetical protein